MLVGTLVGHVVLFVFRFIEASSAAPAAAAVAAVAAARRRS